MTEYIPEILSNIWLYGFVFIGVLSLVIFVHELGHYLAARRAGVGIELFAVGFGREILGHTDSRGTRWSLRLIPLGGYVQMYGEVEVPSIEQDRSKAFFAQSVGTRAMITAAGPAANFIFAILVLSSVYMTIGKPHPELYIAGIMQDGPAQKAGLKIGDVYLSIDGRTVDTGDSIRDLVAGKTGVPLEVNVRRDGQTLSFTVVPETLYEKNRYGLQTSRGTMGTLLPVYGLAIEYIHSVDGIDTRKNIDLARRLLIDRMGGFALVHFGRSESKTYLVPVPANLNSGLLDEDHEDHDVLTLGPRPTETMKRQYPWIAVRDAAKLTWDGINATLGTVFQIIGGLKSANDMGGAIKISGMAGDSANKGLFTFLQFVALLSVSIGMINLLPVPLLDGGHLVFQAVEAIKGRPVSLTTKGYAYGVGLVFLILTVFIVNLNDLLDVVGLK